jgi:hypothetical protein
MGSLVVIRNYEKFLRDFLYIPEIFNILMEFLKRHFIDTYEFNSISLNMNLNSSGLLANISGL